ncbi:hypothetical protein [Sphingosinicella sp. YJ22]|jgi:hypothetical protein|uniref:COG3904 family protein n=1 Tax=Sphingosinicella sp. YJ22 TaxID=1104780 RepID=UPI00140816AC|nr:hypothetical protein [Sphingosinicella sp. YJ22]
MRASKLLAGLVAAALTCGQATAQARDPANPTCPANPDWSNIPSMTFTYEVINGVRVLKAEGRIDQQTPTRLEAALAEYEDQFDEIWLRSPGGDARAGTQAGFIIRQAGYPTRIPAGWACFSACNFMFMGGGVRFVDPGGLFMVHMFTHVGQGSAVRQDLARGGEQTAGIVGEIEQASALLATEDNDFLIRMGVSRNLLTDIMYQVRAVPAGPDRETRRCLSQDEIIRYNVGHREG